jgi:hypothetical protein
LDTVTRSLDDGAATRSPYLNVTLFTVRIDGSSKWRKLPRLSQPNCKETFGIAPVALGSDRVAYVEDCFNPRLPPNKLKRIKAFSFRPHAVRALFPYGTWLGNAGAIDPPHGVPA